MSYVDDLIARFSKESPEFKAAYEKEVRLVAEERERRVALMKAMTNFRKAARVSQQQLAKAMGISQARVSQLEKGVEPLSVDNVLEMLNLLGGELAIVSREEVKSLGLESKVVGPKTAASKPVKLTANGSSRVQPPPPYLSVSEAGATYSGKRSRKPRA